MARHTLQLVRIDDGSARQIYRFFIRKKAGGIGSGANKKIRRVVFLAKGGLKSKDAPFVVPFGIVAGAATGLLVVKFAIRH